MLLVIIQLYRWNCLRVVVESNRQQVPPSRVSTTCLHALVSCFTIKLTTQDCSLRGSRTPVFQTISISRGPYCLECSTYRSDRLSCPLFDQVRVLVLCYTVRMICRKLRQWIYVTGNIRPLRRCLIIVY